MPRVEVPPAVELNVPFEKFAVELVPEIEKRMDRYVALTPTWYTHEFTDRLTAPDLPPGVSFDRRMYPVANRAVRSAFYLATITEDGNPLYLEELGRAFRPFEAKNLGELILASTGKTSEDGTIHLDLEHPIIKWKYIWNRDEQRHLLGLHEFAYKTRIVDPFRLEDLRAAMQENADVPRAPDWLQTLVYTSLQEAATYESHSGLADYLDPVGEALLDEMAKDEMNHYNFYRGVFKKAVEIDPSAATIAVARQLYAFAMPGTGIPGFDMMAAAVASLGIFDTRKLVDNVVEPTLRYWKLEAHKSSMNKDALKALDSIHQWLAHMTAEADGHSKKISDRNARKASRS